MPSNSKRSQITKLRHQPYTIPKRPQPQSSGPSTKGSASTAGSLAGASKSRISYLASTNAAPISRTSSTLSARMMTTRNLCLQVVRKKYPYYSPRNDYEVLCLSSGPYKGPATGIHEYLDERTAREIQRKGSYEAAMAGAKAILDQVVDPTGLKPSPGDPNVFVQPIPDSEYSVRLFPGCAAASEYCLDFVLTATGEAVNSPFKFDLFCVPDPNAPAEVGPVVAMRPLECAFGMPQHKIPPGEEKFVLRDGQCCVLRRPGHKDVRFRVPIRRRPKAAGPSIDAHFLEFPEYVD